VEEEPDLVRQVEVEQIAAGEIDGDANVEAHSQPAGAAAHRLSQHVSRQRLHETRVLGEGNETLRPQESLLRMLPTDERLESEHLRRAQADLRLVVDDQLALLDRAPELAEQLQALGGVDVALRRVDLD